MTVDRNKHFVMKYLIDDPVRDVIGHDQVQLVHLVVHLKTNLWDKFNKDIEKFRSYYP